MSNKLFSINLNFDSLGEAYGWPKNFHDDSAFTLGVNRIVSLSKKMNIPITIFLVGKDLENRKNYEIIKKLSDNENIEIANHSYNHLFNFGSRDEKTTYDEIYKSHEIIYKCTGKESKGFISPTWSISKNTIKNLIKLNYEYDTSFFKSLYLFPAVLKIFASHIFKKKFQKAFQILNRRDYLIPFKYDKEPFFIDSNMNKVLNYNKNSILEIPMPSINRFKPPIWHTTGYMFGWRYLKKNLKKILDNEKPFFYLIHPADFLDKKDLDKRYTLALERMNKFDYKEKINNLEDILAYIISNDYKGVKLIDIAKSYRVNGN
jgi:peptidoglycan/xylan/chitin deacetylase (PgdA/CDA1 family)